MSDSRTEDRDGWSGGAPGGSGPGAAGYHGEATLGDEGAAAGPESFVDPSAGEAAAESAVTPEVREMWARADARTTDDRL